MYEHEHTIEKYLKLIERTGADVTDNTTGEVFPGARWTDQTVSIDGNYVCTSRETESGRWIELRIWLSTDPSYAGPETEIFCWHDAGIAQTSVFKHELPFQAVHDGLWRAVSWLDSDGEKFEY